MPFSLNGLPIQRARLTVPRRNVWEGEVAVAGPLDLPIGAPVALVLGDTTFNGHVVAGGTFLGAAESTYTIAGGVSGWTRPVGPRAPAVPSGVHLATEAAQLATEAGERLDLGGFDLVLGDHWTRPAGPASVALSSLIPPEIGWRVDPDGVTRPGPRQPAPVPPALPLVVEEYDAAHRRARISLPGDNVSALLPGAILAAPNLAAPIVVGETTIRASLESVIVEVLGEGGIVEMLAALVSALTAWRTFLGVWTYVVVGADPGKPNLQALSVVQGLPAELALDKLPGAPGVTSTLAPGALVLVGFRDGSPARPYVAGYLPGVLPLALGLTAQTEIDLTAPVVKAGGTQALALAAPLSAWAGNVNAALANLGQTIAALGAVATTTTKGA